MSLIEQAARRLEQLREAGSQVSGNLAYPAEDAESGTGHEEDDIIERAARKMRQLRECEPAERPSGEAKQGNLEPATPRAAVTVAPLQQPATEPVVPVCHETLSPPLATSEPAHVAGSGKKSRAVEIDFDRIREKGLLTPDQAQSRLANELRVIKRPIINNCASKGAAPVKFARRIMVTSALPGEGKSFISMNLALSIAMERDSTVLLVEGDPTRPALAEMLGIPPSRGLMDLLVDPKIDVSDVMMRTNLGRLSFIPAGTRHEHATELLASSLMEKLVEQLYERYPDRIILFDSPPLLAAPEPRVLAQHMGQVVYVVEAEQTAQSTVSEALASIEACPVVMAVLNKSSSRDEGYYYSYYYSSAE